MAIGRIPEPGTGIPESKFDAKGDLLVGTGADAYMVQGVGSNNQVLMADSAQTDGVKWANEATATLTAKGDILTATAANTLSRLAVGTNGHTLVADSAEATGLKWVAPGGGSSFSGSVVYITSDQSLTNGIEAVLTWDSEYIDTSSYHSTTTNTSRLTVPTTGYYFVYAKLRWAGNATGYRYFFLTKNNSQIQQDLLQYPSNANDWGMYYGVITSATANDYFEVKAAQNSGGSLAIRGTNNGGSLFGAYFIGA